MSRVRMTAEQFALFHKTEAPSGPRKAQVRRRKEDLPENQLEQQILDFLRVRGFRNIRQQVGTYTPYRVLMAISEGKMSVEQAKRNIIRIGTPGMADWLAIRPVEKHGKFGGTFVAFEIFYWEAKAPGKKPKPDQVEWLSSQRATGTPAE
jgi:hypothetical protein